MKKLVFIFALLISCNFSYGQFVGMQIQTGASSFRLSFPDFETYLTSYNNLNSGSSMLDSAKFNRYGAGYHIGMKFRGGPIIMGFNFGNITGFASKATYTNDQSRSFVFKNHYLDFEF